MRTQYHLPWKALLLIALFSVAYVTLSIVKHNHFLSGYDLAVSDQVMWKYAYLHNPITTIHAYPFTYMMADHVEFIYIFLAPLFWIWNDVRALILAQSLFFCLSGIPMYLLARKKGVNEFLSLTLLFSYLFFFGVQNALWNDVHSNVFGTAAIAWLLYFVEIKNLRATAVSFFIAITSKEDMALLTFAIGIVYFLTGKKTTALFLAGASLLYLFVVFVVYFPHFTPQGYRFAGHESLLQTINPLYFADTVSKRQIIVYSLGWFGFLPLLVPLYLLPWLADLFHFFVIGRGVESASEIFLHYRVSLAPLLLWPTIIVFGKWKKLQHPIVVIYLLLCAFAIQYTLHLPLSYLTKSWFWHESPSVVSINHMISYLPKDASVVSQNNITPHIGHRDLIFTLWSDTRDFKAITNSPCGKLQCRWFHWVGNPTYMIVDTSSDWDIRHLLQNRPDYLEALTTFEKLRKIQVVKRDGTTTLYKVVQKP